MKYHTTIRKDEILQLTAIWMELEGIVLSDASQKDKILVDKGTKQVNRQY